METCLWPFLPRSCTSCCGPTTNRHNLGVLWQEPGCSLWLLGPAQVSQPDYLGRARLSLTGHSIKHCPSFLLNGLEWIAAFQLPQRDWARDVCGFFTPAQLSQGGGSTGKVLKSLPSAGKPQSRVRAKPEGGSSAECSPEREHVPPATCTFSVGYHGPGLQVLEAHLKPVTCLNPWSVGFVPRLCDLLFTVVGGFTGGPNCGLSWPDFRPRSTPLRCTELFCQVGPWITGQRPPAPARSALERR